MSETKVTMKSWSWSQTPSDVPFNLPSADGQLTGLLIQGERCPPAHSAAESERLLPPFGRDDRPISAGARANGSMLPARPQGQQRANKAMKMWINVCDNTRHGSWLNVVVVMFAGLPQGDGVSCEVEGRKLPLSIYFHLSVKTGCRGVLMGSEFMAV